MRWRKAKKRAKKGEFRESVSVEASLPPKSRYAGWWTRALALLIDTFMILIPINILIGIIFGYEALKDPENLTVGTFQVALYSSVTILLWRYFQTPGKKALGLNIVNAKTFEKPPIWQLAIRFTAYFLSMISIVGFFIGLFREDKRALHDLISGTALIQTEE
jgi:uncharacterized RDD family membrane protein YckC